MYKKKRKYNTGVQQIYNDTPDYSGLDNYQARQTAKQQKLNSGLDATSSVLTSTGSPIAGGLIKGGSALGDSAESLIGKNSDGSTKVGGFAANKALKGAGVGAAIGTNSTLMAATGGMSAPIGAAAGLVAGGTYGLIKGKSVQKKEKALIKNAEYDAKMSNLNKRIDIGSNTDAMSYAKKGKYKTKSRIIETEGREPIFSPKKKDGTRDLLYFNPNDPTHSEGGVKAQVVSRNSTKYKCGIKKMKYGDGTKKLVTPKKNNAVPVKTEERDIAADKLEYGDNLNSQLELPENDTPISYDLPVQKVNKITPIVNKNINAVKKEITKPVRTFNTVGGEKKINIEKPVVIKNNVTEVNAPRKREIEYSSRVKKYINNSLGDLIPKKDTTYSLNPETGKMVRHLPNINKMYGRKNIGYKYDDLSPEEQKQVQYEDKLRRANKLRKNANILNNSSKYREDNIQSNKTFNKGMEIKGVNNLVSNLKNMKKYKKGTSSLVIPEGSSIITAEGGKNIQAINAYKKGDMRTLDKIINSMPEDKNNSKKKGDGYINSTRPGKAKGYKTKRSQEEQRAMELEYDANPVAFKAKYGNFASGLQESRTNAQKAGLENFTYKGKSYRAGINPMVSRSNVFTINSSNPSNPVLNKVNVPNTGPEVGANLKGIDQNTGEDLKKGSNFDLSSIPSLAEITARQALLNKGVDKVPENYVKFGRYKYASQLPKILAENSMDANLAKNTMRNVSAGNAGNYLSNVSNLSGSKMKANNDAVVQDTLARQDVLNKNVEIGNNETQINVGLKNQFADQKAQNLGAYRDQILAQGRSIDHTIDTAKMNSEQTRINNILLNNLETKNYTQDETGKTRFKKKGAKNLKYKTIRK